MGATEERAVTCSRFFLKEKSTQKGDRYKGEKAWICCLGGDLKKAVFIGGRKMKARGTGNELRQARGGGRLKSSTVPFWTKEKTPW